ncbi:MAG: hypothetical protein A4E50_01323 [Methanosaeta sp. PtaB.Bin087]|nr:MAG: hypothetical protein A4E50_01323 [Methanosaeta sp. PtaB.Bin087]
MARVWLSTWKAGEGERSAIVKLLEPYRRRAAEDVTAKAKTSGEIRRSSEPIPVESWCPFYRALLEFPGGAGAHRVCGALATWLYQAGWSEEEGFQLWGPVAARCDVETRIFFTSFGVINSPNCETIKRRGAGYPALSFGELDLCRPDETCAGCHWPGDYGEGFPTGDGDSGGFHLGDFGAWKDVIKKVKDPATEITEDKVVGQKFELSRDKAATSFSEKMNLAMEAIGGDIHFFDGQIYRPEGAVKISDELYSIAKDHVNRFAVAEVLERLRAKYGLKLVRFDPDPYLLGVRNGVIDLRTGEFRDYRPDDLMTDRIDVAYNPAARCPRFLKFLEEIQPNVTDRLTLVDWFPITGIRKPFPYVLFLLGLGRNGKGIYERLMKRFFGEWSFSTMNLDEVNRTVFAAGSLRNKRGWIASEQQGSKKKPSIGTGFVKLVSGAGAVDADVKNKARVIFEAFFQAIVDTNAMPAIEDTSRGWMERFCKQDLPYMFVANPDPDNPLEHEDDPHLFTKLTTDGELSGILNLLIWRAKEICKTEKIIKRPAADMFAEYTKQSSSLSTFWDEFCDYTPGTPSLQIPTTDIYEAYKRWCSHLVGEVVNEKYFGAYLKRQCGGISPGRKTVEDEDGNNKKVRYYPGLLFDEDRANKAIEALDSERTIQDHQGPSKDHHIPPKNNISRGIGPSGPSNLWISLIERFGDKEKNSLYMEGIFKNDGFDGPDGAAIDSDGSVIVPDGPGDGPNGEVVAEDDEDHHQTIAENLAEDRRRQAEEAERTATPPPKKEADPTTTDEGRDPTPEESEALEVARSLQAAGKRVTFGNVEAYLERRAGGYVEPKVVKRFLNALASQGWTTDKEGALSEGVVG